MPAPRDEHEDGGPGINRLTDGASLVLGGANAFERHGEPGIDGAFLRFIGQRFRRQLGGKVKARP